MNNDIVSYSWGSKECLDFISVEAFISCSHNEYGYYTVGCTMYIVHFTMYIVHCTVYTLQCTLYSVQYIFYINIIMNIQFRMYVTNLNYIKFSRILFELVGCEVEMWTWNTLIYISPCRMKVISDQTYLCPRHWFRNGLIMILYLTYQIMYKIVLNSILSFLSSVTS